MNVGEMKLICYRHEQYSVGDNRQMAQSVVSRLVKVGVQADNAAEKQYT